MPVREGASVAAAAWAVDEHPVDGSEAMGVDADMADAADMPAPAPADAGMDTVGRDSDVAKMAHADADALGAADQAAGPDSMHGREGTIAAEMDQPKDVPFLAVIGIVDQGVGDVSEETPTVRPLTLTQAASL